LRSKCREHAPWGNCPQVAVEGLAGAAAERQGAFAAALAEHQEDVELQVDVDELDPDHLGPSDSGVEQQHEHGGVASALEGVAGATGRIAGMLLLLYLAARSAHHLVLRSVTPVGSARSPNRSNRSRIACDGLCRGPSCLACSNLPSRRDGTARSAGAVRQR
jgi:hypothetical protein